MRNGKTVLACLLAAGLVMNAGGCALLAEEGTDSAGSAQSLTQSQIEEKSKTVTSYDGQYTLMVPKGWTDEGQEANEDAVLTMGSADGALGMNILSEPREDFAQDMTLEEFAELSLESMAVENKVPGDASKLTLDGRPAVLQQMAGDVDELRIHYWIYATEYEDAFARFIFFCVPSDQDKAFPTVQTIVQSIRRNG